MSSLIELKEILLAITSIVIAGLFAILIKKLLYKYRRPNGKRGGIISLHVTIAFAIVTSVAIITRDWFLTSLVVILAYLIGRNLLEKQHYLYQVVLGAIFGVLIPYGMFHLYYKKFPTMSESSSRFTYEDKPDNAIDDREEADEAPELRLEEDLEFKEEN